MQRRHINSQFLQYLVALPNGEAGTTRVPSLIEMSQQLGVSVARLREQLEVARAMGLVEVHPRTGIYRQGYSFYPAVWQSLGYAIELDQTYFDNFAELRNHLEAAYWHQAVRLLTDDDHRELQQLVASAWEKLRRSQVQIPHIEHRQLHMCIYRRLQNPFVLGLLEAYWEAYEAVGLNLYAGYDYLQEVWGYHQSMVDAICSGDFNAGYKALVEHTDLIHHRPISVLIGEIATGESSEQTKEQS
jgi:DNA-binding FadR family transcriptional regulator